MMIKRILLFFVSAGCIAFTRPQNTLLCLFVYFICYPALFINLFYFEKRKLRALLLYAAGVFYFLGQITWLAGPKYHGPYIFLGYLNLCFLLPYPFYILGYFLPKKAKDLNFCSILTLCTLYTFLEYSHLWIFSGFPFHLIGLILSANIYSLQLCSAIGSYGLSFIVIFNALFVAKWYSQSNFYRAAFFAPLPFFFGFILFYTVDLFKEHKGNLRVGILQTGLLVEEKWFYEKYKSSFISSKDQLKRIWQDLEKLPPTDLVILPEVCLPGNGFVKKYNVEELKEIFPEDLIAFFSESSVSNIDIFLSLSIYLNTDIIVGLISEGKNSSFLISSGKIIGSYHKKRLVPFGEYIPLPFLKKFAEKYGMEASFIAGNAFSLMEGKWKILPSICFDEGFPDDFVKACKYKPDIHVNLSNDAWFISSSLARSHFDMGRVRSVENGIYSLRSCNSGISAIVSPKGEILEEMEEKNTEGKMNRGVIFKDVSIYKIQTLFSKLGNSFLLLILLLVTCLLKILSKRVNYLKA